ncbi:hypothetical protein ACES2L_15585 [Bdellovibrio bacteriovorus]
MIYLTVKTASAQVYNSSISAATGGTGRAAVEAGDAAFLNPASLVHLRGHYLFSSFAENEFAVALSDNTQESAFPASLGYVSKTIELPNDEIVQSDITFSLAEFIADKWSFGITGHYFQLKIPGASYSQPNADLGILYTPESHIGWALVVYNAFGKDEDIPEAYRPETSVGGGFNYIYQSRVRFRLDATSKSLYMAGIETYINDFVITRLGYQNNTEDKRELITAGLGFKGPRFALNYAYQGNSQISGDYRHSVDLEIPF